MLQIYKRSINYAGGSEIFLAKYNDDKMLVVRGGDYFTEFNGEDTVIDGETVKICTLSLENVNRLRKIFPWLNPVSAKGKSISIGLGDRLGLASAGHIQTIKETGIFPVLAQQSMRELNLTGRTYPEVLKDAIVAVFQEGYKDGFGADGDHLKHFSEVQEAINDGFTMITLDCSEHINNDVDRMSDDEVSRLYNEFPEDIRAYFESKYLGQSFDIDEFTIIFTAEDLMRTVLIYNESINFAATVYHNAIKACGRDIDFEVSIDETLSTTSPQAHLFTATELLDKGVVIRSLAPRFYGEFQKGIDYVGDITQFSKEFEKHYKIANKLGYKISVHSGSDKFSVFPIIGSTTDGKYHLKTAGTNWLEAVRVIAVKEPSLYRRIHKYALSVLDDAKQYYHISAKHEHIPNIDNLSDKQLSFYLERDDSRQVLHITYGLILDKMREEIFAVLEKNEDAYNANIKKHIGKHLELLGV